MGRVMRGFWAALLVVGTMPCVEGQVIKTEPMAVTAHPSFEVAAVKRSDPADQMHRFSILGHRLLIENQTVSIMIQMSYGVHRRQIVNAPPWVETERFDIQGMPDAEGQPNVVQFQEMVRKLLADRFGLKLHTDKREMARYTLTVAKGGPKMEPTKSAPDALPNENGNGDEKSMSLQMTNVSMGDLAHDLQGELDRPVVDETGLKGRYDFSLKWSRADAAVTGGGDSALPGIFTALQEQAGLKVEPSKGEVDVLVIESLEQPETN
jgi:uncharacterized protein (TIGR03435 family)